ncbi:MAG: Gfo/Idh/MocA family protein [Candidatus Hodarchaeota archaeon]
MMMRNGKPVQFALFGAGTRGELDLGYFFDKLKKDIKYCAVAEPDPYRRKQFIERFKIPEENAFEDYKELLEKPKLADAIINALPCKLHHDSTAAALEAGYDVLLEKPMAHTPAECIHLEQLAKKYKQKLSIAFENRYNKIYLKINELLKKDAIGELMDITCSEHIGYWHFIMSYVRGIHSLAEDNNSFMIAKGIHDMDLLHWFTGSKGAKVSCFGDLSYFNGNNAPEGGPERCTDGTCPVQKECIFDALKQYYKPGRASVPISILLSQSFRTYIDFLKDPRFRTFASIISRDLDKEKVLEALKNGPHGKCVFRSENGVTDHQTTSIQYENGVTCSFSMSAFSIMWERNCDLRGTNGEIYSKDYSGKLQMRIFNPSGVKKWRIPYHGIHHGGGDEGLLLDFARSVRSDDPDVKSMTAVENCVESHLLAFAAEEARLNNKVIDMKKFREKAEEEARKL